MSLSITKSQCVWKKNCAIVCFSSGNPIVKTAAWQRCQNSLNFNHICNTKFESSCIGFETDIKSFDASRTRVIAISTTQSHQKTFYTNIRLSNFKLTKS